LRRLNLGFLKINEEDNLHEIYFGILQRFNGGMDSGKKLPYHSLVFSTLGENKERKSKTFPKWKVLMERKRRGESLN